ncbi:MAG: hypothetical protein ACQESC_00065 [Nanobdellota archaeon]
MVINSEQIISLLRRKGPLVPAEIKREVGGDTIVVGAILSEQVSKGSIIATHLKRGSSPLYYVPGQEPQLEKFKDLLDPKDRRTLELLSSRKILQDASLELLYRVSLRKLKDFAKPFEANTIYGKLLFWRYYLIDEESAMKLLKERFNESNTTTQSDSKTPEETKETTTSTSPNKTSQEQATTQSTSTTPQEQSQQEPVRPSENKTETTNNNQEHKNTPQEQSTVWKGQQQLDKIQSTNKTQHPNTNTQEQTLSQLSSSPFLDKINEYFTTKKCTILWQEQRSKNREYEFIITVDSAIGDMEFFALAKNKKKLNEGDLAPALLKAKQQDLPCLFLTTGQFTKKSLSIAKQEYKGLFIDYIKE